jgi:hypothetical protein
MVTYKFQYMLRTRISTLKGGKLPISFQHYKIKEEARASSLVLLLNCLQSTSNFLDLEDFQEISDLDIVVGFE